MQDEIERRRRSDPGKVHFLGSVPTCVPFGDECRLLSCPNSLIAHVPGCLDEYGQIDQVRERASGRVRALQHYNAGWLTFDELGAHRVRTVGARAACEVERVPFGRLALEKWFERFDPHAPPVN